MTDRVSEIKQNLRYLGWDDMARSYQINVAYLLTELERVEAERDRYKQAAEMLREELKEQSIMQEVIQ